MKIVIDARMLYWTGVGRYTRALLDHLEQADSQNSYVVLVRLADWKLWEPSKSNFTKVRADIDPYTFAEQLKLPGLIRGLRPDLVHFTTPNVPLLYRGRQIVTVHDLTLLDWDTSRGNRVARRLRGSKRIPFRVVLATAVRRAERVITVTNYVKDQLVVRFGLDQARIRVTPLAADAKFAEPTSLERFGLGPQYLFEVGNSYPYKNIGSTIRALKLLHDTHPTLELVLAGNPDYFRDRLIEMADRLGLRDRVKFIGRPSDAELISLYRHATIYVNPSKSEGFGLQGLEAMAQGLPVVAARASCLPEVYGTAARYFDPDDVASQAEAIRELLDHPKSREDLVRAGHERLETFSWDRTAEATLQVYQELA